MQYLLTDDEYKALTNFKDERLEKVAEATRVLILKQANFECIHREGISVAHAGYCDDCPIVTQLSSDIRAEVCKKPKNFSK